MRGFSKSKKSFDALGIFSRSEFSKYEYSQIISKVPREAQKYNFCSFQIFWKELIFFSNIDTPRHSR